MEKVFSSEQSSIGLVVVEACSEVAINHVISRSLRGSIKSKDIHWRAAHPLKSPDAANYESPCIPRRSSLSRTLRQQASGR
jgi:hypothetical protein